MIKNSVWAVVVSYNGDVSLKQNIINLSEQVEGAVIVDNHSATDMSDIFSLCKNLGLEIIQNDENLGIATALNIGTVIGEKRGYKYLLTMDQDSILATNAVEEMITAMESDASIASVGVNYDNVESDVVIDKDVLIASGNLVKMDVYRKVNGFNDKLFIDSVDFDFSLAIKKMGYRLVIVPKARMEHKIGEVVQGKFLFFRHNICQHSPFRCYYIYRNHKYLVAKYKKDFPKFCFKLKIVHLKDTISILMFHPNKKEKIKAILKGKRDAKLLIKELKN